MLQQPLDLKKKIDVYKLADAAYYLVLCAYLIRKLLTSTTFNLEIEDDLYTNLLNTAIIIVAIRLALILYKRRKDWRYIITFILPAIIFGAIYFCVYQEGQSAYFADQYVFLLFLAVLTVGSIDIDYRLVLKLYIFITAVFILAVIILAWVGAANNLVYLRNGELRSCWGISYPTDLASYFLFLSVFAWVYIKEKTDCFFLIPAAVTLGISALITHSRTGTVCSLIFVIAICFVSAHLN